MLMITYEIFEEDNNGKTMYGLNWMDEDGMILDSEYFSTEEERQEVIDQWYANEQDVFTPEQ